MIRKHEFVSYLQTYTLKNKEKTAVYWSASKGFMKTSSYECYFSSTKKKVMKNKTCIQMHPQPMSNWWCFFPLCIVLHQQSNLFPRSVLISGFHSARCYDCQSLHENQQNLNHGTYPHYITRPAEFSLIFGWGWWESGKEVKFLSACSLICVLCWKKTCLTDSFPDSTLWIYIYAPQTKISDTYFALIINYACL